MSTSVVDGQVVNLGLFGHVVVLVALGHKKARWLAGVGYGATLMALGWLSEWRVIIFNRWVVWHLIVLRVFGGMLLSFLALILDC